MRSTVEQSIHGRIKSNWPKRVLFWRVRESKGQINYLLNKYLVT